MPISTPYTPPGLSITEITTPVVNPVLASGSNICLIGTPGPAATAVSPITTTDTIILGLTSNPIVLPTIQSINNDAQLVSVISVTDVLNPSYGTPAGAGYVSGTDFTVQVGEGPPNGTNATITWLNTGHITAGTLCAVTYTYLPFDYWDPVVMYDAASVTTRFGDIWATTSTNAGLTVYSGINSPLSLAAVLAFRNGASSVICQPLYASGPVAATGTAIGSSTTWQTTLTGLEPYPNIDLIVPVVGFDGTNVSTNDEVLSIFEAVQAFQAYMNSNNSPTMAIFGEDGTVSQTQYQSTLPPNSVQASHAAQLQSNYANALSSQAVLINNTVFQMTLPGTYSGSINVGGQYAAAALAGAISARSTSASMTRQYISGFASMSDTRNQASKNADAAAGLLVLENYNGGIRCRQGITLDIADGVSRQEISVVRSKFLLMESIYQTLDNQIVGQIIADANAPLVVSSAVTGVLSLLQEAGTIVGFSGVQATLSSTNPATATVTFSYQPAFPLNYIAVQFSLDLTTGTVSTVTS